ncbi:VOC family protein [Shewanella sp. NIFS-20-20]|uniref:VOC family protein n=1 Tax=Shewanella sp. NIFS-20-20 TaxID=2853806 RepID=UPI001C48C322|nr:VOC family protein [Shewanella sp. NIFS-20-20]MBV7316591.1 VOC family protein [Shewanella sp. NIFS-20-20]
MAQHHSINYLEIPVRDMALAKAFFTRVFGWQFSDYGPHYSCFNHVGIDGGFYEDALCFNTAKGCPLVVIYSEDLAKTAQDIVNAGGEISKNTFSFPGGQRFHFCCPNGNEYAVWSE